jgi:hypothetical protein
MYYYYARVDTTLTIMPKSHKKKLLIIGILFVVFIIGLLYIDKKWTQPRATNAVSSPYPITKQETLNLIPTNYSDKFVSFSYPTIMTSNQTPNFNLPIVDIVNMSYPDAQSWLLSVDVSNIPSGNLYDNEAYQARIVNPTTYLLSQTTINGMSVPIFTDKTASGYSRVAFLLSGDYQATVSLTGDDTSGVGPLASTMAIILNSWKWQGSY